MADAARQSVEIRDFPGVVDNTDEQDLPRGAAIVQTNVVSITPGELTTRGGYRTVSFEA